MDHRRRRRLRASLGSGRLGNFKELEILANKPFGIRLDTNSARFSTTGINGDIQRFMSGDGASVIFPTYQSSPHIAADYVGMSVNDHWFSP